MCITKADQKKNHETSDRQNISQFWSRCYDLVSDLDLWPAWMKHLAGEVFEGLIGSMRVCEMPFVLIKSFHFMSCILFSLVQPITMVTTTITWPPVTLHCCLLIIYDVTFGLRWVHFFTSCGIHRPKHCEHKIHPVTIATPSYCNQRQRDTHCPRWCHLNPLTFLTVTPEY